MVSRALKSVADASGLRPDIQGVDTAPKAGYSVLVWAISTIFVYLLGREQRGDGCFKSTWFVFRAVPRAPAKWQMLRTTGGI